MFPILLQLGPITLHTYGLMVAIGFLLALRVARGQFEQQGIPDVLLDRIVFALMVFGLLGARILYFGVDNFIELRGDPFSFFRIWEGGLVLYGGVIAGLIVLAVFSRRHGIPFLTLTDAFTAPLLLGQAIGRLGCFSAGCCYGRPTNKPWGVIFKHPASLAPRFTPLHPTQLYEFAGDLVLFGAAMWLSQRETRRGTLTSFYLIVYGIFRFAMELLRGDDRGITHFGHSPSQLVAAAMIVTGLGLTFTRRKNAGA